MDPCLDKIIEHNMAVWVDGNEVARAVYQSLDYLNKIYKDDKEKIVVELQKVLDYIEE
jgi:hypothetical protein